MNSIAGIIPSTAIASAICFAAAVLIFAVIAYYLLHNVVVPVLGAVVLEAAVAACYFTDRTLLEGAFPRLLSNFYMNGRLTGFFDGILDIPGIVYYVTIAAAALFLTVQSVSKRRWNHSKRLNQGGYSILMTVIVVAVSVMINLIVGKAPSQYTNLDFSTAGLYTLTDTTKEFLAGLEKDVEIYYICETGNEDDTTQKLLERYEDACDRLTIRQIDPILYPGFTSRYTEEKVESGSVIVVCGEISRVVTYEDMYQSEYSYQTSGYVETGYDGEGRITSAIDYVTTGNVPVFYVLNGNGEVELGSSFRGAIEKNNIRLQDLNLLSETSIPEDAAAVMICAPTRDYNENELKAILAYLEKGGKAIIFSNYLSQPMPNFSSLLSNYGLAQADGVILEGSSGNYMTYQYCLLPDVYYTAVTAKVYGSMYVLCPMAQGICELDSRRSTISYQPLFVTSADAYSKVDVQGMTTYEKEAGDIDGPFTIGMLIQEDVNHDDTTDTEIVYYSTGFLLDEDYNLSVSGGNAELVGDTAAYLISNGFNGSTAVPVKSLQVAYLTMTSQTANFWTVICVFVLPVLFILTGLIIWWKRRRR